MPMVVILLLALWLLWTPDLNRADLERRYLAAPTDMVQVQEVKLHVRDSGPRDAPAVLMLHGFAGNLQTWDAWARDLSGPLRVIRLDLPGSGLSHPDPTGDYSDRRSLQLILALMDQLHLARASVIGHSIGGRIAWTMAATHPERVNKLVLLAPDGFTSPGETYGAEPKVPVRLQLMRFMLPKWLLRLNLEPAYASTTTLSDDRATLYHDLMLAPGSRQALMARLQQRVLVDPLPLLQHISAPTLLLWGKQDALIPFATAANYTQAIPHSRLIALEGVGHLPQEEKPELSLPPVQDFLLLKE